MIRTFVAIELPPPIRAGLAEWSQRLHGCWPDGAVRWVPADGMHLTLRFLGATEEERVPALAAGLDGIAADQSAFDIEFSDLGGFPSLRRARVVWVGLREADEQVLAPLQKKVERLARRLGWQHERQRYKPHITLGRLRGKGEQRGRFGETGPPSPPAHEFAMTGMTLFHSDLTPTGAEYRVLHRAEFGTAR